MSINLDEAMEEYARLPFMPYGVYYTEHPPGYIQEEYTMGAASFIFALCGEAVVYLDEQSFEFGSGRVIHCAPGKRFNATNGPGSRATLFELVYLPDGANADYMRHPYDLEIGVSPRLISLLRQLDQLQEKSNAHSPLPPSSLHMKALVYSVLSEMFSCAQSIRQSGANNIAEDAKSYLERHYAQPHTLDGLGSRYGMGGKYFSDVFKKHMGISPIDYLIACRLGQARDLLETTGCSVREIGKSVGYEDAKYFCRQFKKKYDASPSEWREHILSGASGADRKQST
jgi:AraC-like DNA-binding protein